MYFCLRLKLYDVLLCRGIPYGVCPSDGFAVVFSVFTCTKKDSCALLLFLCMNIGV